MRVVRCLRKDDHDNHIAANYSRERALNRKCDNYIQLRMRGHSTRKDCGQNEKYFFHNLKFVCAVRAENEFKLKKDRIYVAIGQKEVLGEKVVIVLQADL